MEKGKDYGNPRGMGGWGGGGGCWGEWTAGKRERRPQSYRGRGVMGTEEGEKKGASFFLPDFGVSQGGWGAHA